MLGGRPTPADSKLWSTSLDHVKTREMPPEKDSKLNGAERLRLVGNLEEKVRNFYDSEVERKPAGPRRLNNRGLANSISDVLMIKDVGTSPIHRAVYVMENSLGIHPVPPPPGVEFCEPDVRQAKTIKEILTAHTSEPNCASCYRIIDTVAAVIDSPLFREH